MSEQWSDPLKGFGFPIVFAVGVHALVAVMVFSSWSFSNPKTKTFEIPASIKAKVVSIEQPKPVATPKPTAQPKAVPTPTPVAKPQPKPAPVAQAKAPEVEKPAVTVPKELASEPAPTPKEVVPEVVTPSPEDIAKAAAEVEAQEAALFDDFLAGLDAEDEKIVDKLAQIDADKARAEIIGQEIEQYTMAINQQISQRWSRPAELRLKDLTDLEAKVHVQLLPTGELSAVSLVESSGMQTYDQSVLRAIERVRRFNVPEDPEVFEAGGFRSLIITFIPEDLIQP